MAIFYSHIKGCGNNTTGITESLPATSIKNTNDEAWTWIKWADTITYTKNPSADLAYVENNPYIYLNNVNLSGRIEPENSALSLGRIITSRSKGQEIYVPFTFRSPDDNTVAGNLKEQKVLINQRTLYPALELINYHLYLVSNPTSENMSETKVIVFHQRHDSSEEENDKYACIYCTPDGFVFDAHKYDNYSSVGKLILKGDDVQVKEGLYVAKNIYTGADTYTWATSDTSGIIKAENRCEARYFNATSDRRAKSNIIPADFSALSVVKQLPVYTFQYLNVEEPVIGLIAQEAAEHNLDGFNMVDNLDASGECGDFMQMKESKLVYVLWKAVQELSAEVEELKTEIRNLK